MAPELLVFHDRGGESVYAYLDEASELKSLPVNQRASAIAEACGFSGCQFRGAAEFPT